MSAPTPARRHRDAARHALDDGWTLFGCHLDCGIGDRHRRMEMWLARAFARWEARGYKRGVQEEKCANAWLAKNAVPRGLVEGRVQGNYPVTVSASAANCRLSLVPPKARKPRRKP